AGRRDPVVAGTAGVDVRRRVPVQVLHAGGRVPDARRRLLRARRGLLGRNPGHLGRGAQLRRARERLVRAPVVRWRSASSAARGTKGSGWPFTWLEPDTTW